MLRARLASLAALVAVLWPTAASANAGSPLIFAGLAHLLVLNLVIGLVEGWLLARWGAVPRARTNGVMILANYVSAWAGAFGLPWLLLILGKVVIMGPPLYTAGRLVVGMVVGSFIWTVLLELPFVLLCLRGSRRSLRERLAAGVWVQALGYAGLVPLYLAAGSMSAITGTTRVRDVREFVPSMDAWVYYVDSDAEAVWRVRPDGTGRERAAPASGPLTSPSQGLWLRPSDDGRCDLMCGTGDEAGVVISDLRGRAGDRGPNQGDRAPAVVWPIDFRAENDRALTVVAMPTSEGLFVQEWVAPERRFVRRIYTVAFSTAFWEWYARCPSILPGDLVVFELGGQIVVLNAATRQIGVVAMGRSPAVLLGPGTDRTQP
jgi:hypothetical protein